MGVVRRGHQYGVDVVGHLVEHHPEVGVTLGVGVVLLGSLSMSSLEVDIDFQPAFHDEYVWVSPGQTSSGVEIEVAAR